MIKVFLLGLSLSLLIQLEVFSGLKGTQFIGNFGLKSPAIGWKDYITNYYGHIFVRLLGFGISLGFFYFLFFMPNVSVVYSDPWNDDPHVTIDYVQDIWYKIRSWILSSIGLNRPPYIYHRIDGFASVQDVQEWFFSMQGVIYKVLEPGLYEHMLNRPFRQNIEVYWPARPQRYILNYFSDGCNHVTYNILLPYYPGWHETNKFVDTIDNLLFDADNMAITPVHHAENSGESFPYSKYNIPLSYKIWLLVNKHSLKIALFITINTAVCMLASAWIPADIANNILSYL